MSHSKHNLLQRPLYIFDLPEELLYSLQLKVQTIISEPASRTSPPSPRPSSGTEKEDGASAVGQSCNLCALSFPTLQEQRIHVRSDLHTYNLKQKMRGRKTATEAEFEQLIQNLDESLSGSDSDETDESQDEKQETTLSALLKRQAKLKGSDAEDGAATKRKRGSGKPPLLWFGSSKLPANMNLGIYRAVFSEKEQENEEGLVDVVRRKQLAAKPPPKPQKVKGTEDEGGVALPTSLIQRGTSAAGPHYFLCMIGGGHFAAMIVSLTPKLAHKAGQDDRSATVIAHKTFHRYTTRRKQGGSQSANDNSKGNAHSAGSSLRRYNEAALTQEVRDLLRDWKSMIDSAELLFVRASGTTSRRTLFGPYEAQVLSPKDERLRGFPFSTRRATQSELMRSFVELTRVKILEVDEEAERRKAEEEATAAAKAEEQRNGKPSPTRPVRASKQDEEAMLHTTQLQALIRRSKAPAMLSYLQSNGLAPDFRFFPIDQNSHAPTALHLAASSNSAACVSALLCKAGADPGTLNSSGKPAFDLAGDRATRDAFRLARSVLGPDRWDWSQANVPAPLTQAQVDERAVREQSDRDAEKDAEKNRRAAEIERLRKEDTEKATSAREQRLGKGSVLGGAPKMTAEERRMEDARGMSDEMRLRLERERRARAAEERIRRMQQGS